MAACSCFCFISDARSCFSCSRNWDSWVVFSGNLKSVLALAFFIFIPICTTSDEVSDSFLSHGYSCITVHARRHAFHAEKFQPKPLSELLASIISFHELNPCCPMRQRLIAAEDGRPLDRISGKWVVTASINIIHWAGLFSVPSASTSAERASRAALGMN